MWIVYFSISLFPSIGVIVFDEKDPWNQMFVPWNNQRIHQTGRCIFLPTLLWWNFMVPLMLSPCLEWYSSKSGLMKGAPLWDHPDPRKNTGRRQNVLTDGEDWQLLLSLPDERKSKTKTYVIWEKTREKLTSESFIIKDQIHWPTQLLENNYSIATTLFTCKTTISQQLKPDNR